MPPGEVIESGRATVVGDSVYLKPTGSGKTSQLRILRDGDGDIRLQQKVQGKIIEYSKIKPPNQSSEPTTTAVTICAAAQIAPAAVVAHL